MLMYGANIYFWRRYRVNYSFIFGFKEETDVGYLEVLLLSFGLAALALASVLSNLDMHSPEYNSFTELLPLYLIFVRLYIQLKTDFFFFFHISEPNPACLSPQLLLIILFCPFNIIYRTGRYFFLTCLFHSIFAPLYKVNGGKI